MRVVATVVALVAATAGIFVLREATITREVTTASHTEMEVRLRIHTNEEGADPERLADSLFSLCRLQVDAVRSAGPEPVGGGVFAFRLRPTLDESDRRQLEGCIEDAHVDHVQGDVLTLRQVR